jgi:uncharacterized protein (TIGR02246 family)
MGSEQQIRQLIVALGRHIGAGEFDLAAACFAPDAVLMLPGSPMVRGRAAIRAALAEMFGSGTPGVEVVVDRVEVADSDDLAHALGTGVTLGAPTLRSKWVAAFRRQDGAWKIVVDAYNADS